MSSTRKSNASLPSQSSFWDYYLKSIVVGMTIGSVSSTLAFPIDKISFAYQTQQAGGSSSFRGVLAAAFRKPFSGYLPTIANASCKNVIMFPAKAYFERRLECHYPGSPFNTRLAGFFAGLLAVYMMSPISVIKALRYNNMPVKEIRQLNYHSLFRGVHATAMRDGVQFGAFFEMYKEVSKHISNPSLAGSVSSMLACGLSNPFSVIGINQKVSGLGFFAQAKTLYQGGGLRRFYPGFFRTTAMRMGLKGAVMGQVIDSADRAYHWLSGKDIFETKVEVMSEETGQEKTPQRPEM